MISDELRGRLLNWKFGQALNCLDEHVTYDERVLIESLADTFGNIGHFDGHMAIIVRAAVSTIVPDEDGT